MRVARVLVSVLPVVAMLVAAPSGWANHNTDVHSDNMRLVNRFNDGGKYQQGSDEAFWGTKAIVGNYGAPGGLRVLDISNPTFPTQLGILNCPGPQSDVTVWENLVFMSVDSPREDEKCGTEAASQTTATSGDAFEGIRVISIADPAHPTQIATVKTDCGSHTNTLVPDLAKGRVLLYVQSYPLTSQNPNCNVLTHRKISVVEVPLDNPAAAKVIATPSVSPAIGCHDVTVFLERKLAAAGCISESQLWDISDPANPTIVGRIYNPAINIHHSAAFAWDGKTIVLGDELGGAEASPGCIGPQEAPIGALWFYDVSDPTDPVQRGSFRIPQQELSADLCTAHDFNIVPLPSGKDVLVSAWYVGGTTVVDFTDPANARQLAYYKPREPVPAVAWSSYWYNGHIFANNYDKADRGFDVFEVTAPELAGALTLDHLNPATQEPFPGTPPTGGNVVGTGKHCLDGARPRSRFDRRRMTASRRRLSLRGTSTDPGCSKARAGKVARVEVAVARVTGRKCRFMRTGGKFGAARSCASPKFLRARGGRNWSLTARGRFAPGRYRAWVRARDARGNLERRNGRNTLSFRIR